MNAAAFRRLRVVLGLFLLAGHFVPAARAQDQVEIIIRSNLGSATQVVMPQTRSFTIEGDRKSVV